MSIHDIDLICWLTGSEPEPTVYDGTNATRIAYLCKESFLKNELLKME